MSVVIILIFIVLAIGIVGLAVLLIRAVSSSAVSAPVTTGASGRRPLPDVTDFHVKGATASVVFAVPLGEGEIGAHLTELLNAAAIEYLREKVADGLPLEDVTHVAVHAMRAGQPELIDTVDLPEPGGLPEPAPILHRDPTDHNPISTLQAVKADTSVAAPSDPSESLPSVSAFVELSSPTEAHLRSIGVDPASMSLEDLVLGLLRVGGYQVDGATGSARLPSVQPDDVYLASKDGLRTLVVVVPHEPGTYPELDEKVLAEFSVAVSQANPAQAMLVTDKFGPYAIYERERRDARLVFVTRERLQAFVDSFGFGS